MNHRLGDHSDHVLTLDYRNVSCSQDIQMLPQLIVIEVEISLLIGFITIVIPCFLIKHIVLSISQLNLPDNQICKYLVERRCPPCP